MWVAKLQKPNGFCNYLCNFRLQKLVRDHENWIGTIIKHVISSHDINHVTSSSVESTTWVAKPVYLDLILPLSGWLPLFALRTRGFFYSCWCAFLGPFVWAAHVHRTYLLYVKRSAMYVLVSVECVCKNPLYRPFRSIQFVRNRTCALNLNHPL